MDEIRVYIFLLPEDIFQLVCIHPVRRELTAYQKVNRPNKLS